MLGLSNIVDFPKSSKSLNFKAQMLWIIAAVLLVIYLKRATIYDIVIVRMTTRWYLAVLERLPKNARLLDIGIGTGSALLNNRRILEEKKISVHGIDYDNQYILKCKRNIESTHVNNVTAECISVYDYKGRAFDAAYFSGSLMIMPDPVAALNVRCQSLCARCTRVTHYVCMLHCEFHEYSTDRVRSVACLKPGGVIYVTQTFEAKSNRALELLKPLLKFLTTIDFGRVTYEEQFLETVKQAKLFVIESKVIDQRPSR